MSNRESFADLEYGRLAEQIVHRCHSGLGRAKAAQLQPLASKPAIEAGLRLVWQLQEGLQRGLDPDLSELADLTELFTDPAYSLFGFEEFQRVYQNARLAGEIASRAKTVEDLPDLNKLWSGVQALPFVCQRFGEIFDPEGEVLDSASPELARLRKRSSSLQRNILKTMQGMVNDPRFEGYLQDKFITRRDERYVLPVKESAGPNVPGIVQSQSGTGSTLFIEPQSVVPLNNELQLLKQEEKREIFNIFTAFTALVKEQRKTMLANQAALAELDFRFACARLCRQLDAKMPRIAEKPVLRLSSARHPLLILRLGKPALVVPFDLDLGDGTRIILLSGPNTGGKTVLMKSAGLLSLMALSGLPIPAGEESEVGLFSQVFADIGDDQSIESALSTFSSHIQKIQRMLASADENSLVLIDEIGAATDPQQGSALAQAILERFTQMNCKAIVTTHYTALKIFAETHPGCLNASMQFDLKSLQPTFRFSTGIPGDSFAIEVASSLGLEPSLIDRARHLSGSQNVEFTALLKKMQEEKKALGKASYEYQLKTRNLEAKLKELEGREAKLDAELKERKQKFIRELQSELISQQKLYQKEQESLKKLEREERKSLSERKLHEISDRLQSIRTELAESGTEGHERAQAPQPGDRVWLANFDAEATVVEIKDQTAIVDMNGISFRTPLESLYAAKTAPPAKENAPLARTSATVTARFELKLLGLTFDEAQPLIDEFLDDAFLAGLHTLRIVHGKGTGALRSKVREYLKRKKQVISLETPPPNEGGSGVTLVKI
ncbi:MAG TPA: endonuclease MutS2 [Candidatus Syntrophosphaera sp.]|nr:endonuclease MutS2 [Candidatus Syntrophosphaera sp.]